MLENKKENMFYPMFEQDLMFNDISIYKLNIPDSKIEEFKHMVLDEDLPNEYTLDLPEFTFSVNQSERIFKILKRNYNPLFFSRYIDRAVYIAYATAQKSGFKSFLETKFYN